VRKKQSYRAARRNDARQALTNAKTERRRRKNPKDPPIRWFPIWQTYQMTWPWEKLQ
jgi:hypothetical protein